MKISKTLSCVLGLHVIIAVLLVQPGCQTGQPPTQTSSSSYTQNRTINSSVVGASRTRSEFIPATHSGGLDAAFNSGMGGDTSYEPLDPLDPLDPLHPLDPLDPLGPLDPIDSLEPLSNQQTVDIAGPSFQSYTIKRGDNLWSLSKRFGVSLNELYAANGLNKNSVIRVGQQIQIPSEGSTVAVNTVTPEVYQPSGFNQETTSYTVRRGDNLSRIANQFDTSVRALKAANNKTSDVIRVGETLIVPVGANANTTATTATTANRISATVSSGSTATATVASSRSGGTQTHTVKAGEYPGKIAKQYGMTTSELLAMNSITDPRKLRIGQNLIVSGSGSAENVDSRVDAVGTARTVGTARSFGTVAAPATTLQPVPVQTETITVIEADPILEGEFPELEVEVEDDSAFNNAVEIPVIRLQD